MSSDTGHKEIKKRRAYYLQWVTLWVASNIVTSISICHVWHDNERVIIKFIRTEEF